MPAALVATLLGNSGAQAFLKTNPPTLSSISVAAVIRPADQEQSIRHLSRETLAKLQIQANGVFVFGQVNEELNGLKPGDIFALGSLPGSKWGSLREIVSTSFHGKQYVLETKPLTHLCDLGQAHLDYTGHLSANEIDKRASTLAEMAARGDTRGYIDVPLSNLRLPPGLVVTGSLKVRPHYGFNLSIDRFQLDLFKISTNIDTLANIHVTGNIRGSLNQQFTMGSIGFLPIPLDLGSIPIVLRAELSLVAGVQVSQQGPIDLWIRQDGPISSLVIQHASTVSSQCQLANPLDVHSAGGAVTECKMYFGPKLSFALSGIDVYGMFDQFLRLDRYTAVNPPLALYTGSEFQIGLEGHLGPLALPILQGDWTIWEQEIGRYGQTFTGNPDALRFTKLPHLQQRPSLVLRNQTEPEVVLVGYVRDDAPVFLSPDGKPSYSLSNSWTQLELLRGSTVRLLAKAPGWCLVQTAMDGEYGWIRLELLTDTCPDHWNLAEGIDGLSRKMLKRIPAYEER